MDFAVNKQWISWSEEALRRFLAKQGMSSSGPSLYPEICSQIKLTPAQSTKTNEGSLLFPPANGESAFVTPSMFDDKPDTNRTEQIFGGLTNAMALEDSMWDINMVSDGRVRLNPSFGWRLTFLLHTNVESLEETRHGEFVNEI